MARAQIWQGIAVAFVEVVCIGVLAVVFRHQHTFKVDDKIDRWIVRHDSAMLHQVADWAGLIGTLPIVGLAAIAGMMVLRTRHRPWQKTVVLLWSLCASEVVGLFLLLFLGRNVTSSPVHWLAGLPWLTPLRSVAVYGTLAYVLTRSNKSYRPWTHTIAASLAVVAGATVVWTREQTFTEVVLEYVAGVVILFAGAWWLEGYGPGFAAVGGQRSEDGGPTPEEVDSTTSDHRPPTSEVR
jgi:hypothetical protein